MQLETLSVYVDVRPTYMSEKDYNVKLNLDGFLEYTEKGKKKFSRKTLVLIYKDFHVAFHAMFDKDFKKYKEVLIAFKNFFDVADHKWIVSFCQQSCINFSVGISDEPPHMSEQTDLFIKLYKRWWFLEFDYSFDSLNTMKEFREFLEKNCFHQVYDRDWPQTKIFIKKITRISLNNVFKILELIIGYENCLTKKMYEAKEKEFKKQKDVWKKQMIKYL